MANIRLIRRRIRSIRNTAKITHAMEMVAASKMRRAQERGLAGRPYAEKITQVISDLAAIQAQRKTMHPLLERRAVKTVCLVVITPDRGLCGGLVSNLNREVAEFLLRTQAPAQIVAIGRKGADFLHRSGQRVIAEFIGLSDRPSLADTLAISKIIIDGFTDGSFDAVYLAYSQFVNTAVQRPLIMNLLPVEPAPIPKQEAADYIYEPNAAMVLDGLLPRFVEMQLYHAILEAIASEQSARMVAMRTATDNAEALISDLTLAYNKARQESITTELLDIVGGAAALGK